MVSCEIYETFNNIYFVEHLQTTASGSCKHLIYEIRDKRRRLYEMIRDKRRRFKRIFLKDEATLHVCEIHIL